MDIAGKHMLITGSPGVGKTTLIRKIAEGLKDYQPAGFYTEEIRESGIRKGFDLISLDGRRAHLSHVNIKSSYKVGKYGVDVAGFEDFIDKLPLSGSVPSTIIIDEIGRMECYSTRFVKLINDILASESLLIATVAIKGSGLITDVKKRNDVRLFEVTRENRDDLGKIITVQIMNGHS